MNIGVAIVTHNNKNDIEACIASVISEGIENIAIVDSASTDGMAEVIQKMPYAHELLPENKGFAYAANRAAHLLNTQYVLFLNPDAKLLFGSISHALKTIQASPAVRIVGLMLCDDAGIPERAAYGKEPTLFQLMVRHVYRPEMLKKPFAINWVSGGALLVSRKIFQHIGGFDESFFLYWEDVDLCRRVRNIGYEVVLDPEAKVFHRRGGSNLSEHKKNAIYDVSADRYYKKHYSTPIWAIQRFLRKIYRR